MNSFIDAPLIFEGMGITFPVVDLPSPKTMLVTSNLNFKVSISPKFYIFYILRAVSLYKSVLQNFSVHTCVCNFFGKRKLAKNADCKILGKLTSLGEQQFNLSQTYLMK